MTMDLQLIAEGFEFPEGPIAMADGTVILTEIKAQRLTRVHPDGRKETVVETGGGPNGAAIGPDGDLHHQQRRSFTWPQQDGLTIPADAGHPHRRLHQRFDLATGELKTLYETRRPPLRRPQRPGVRQAGRVWFSDHGTNEGRKFGAFYYAKTTAATSAPARYLIAERRRPLARSEDRLCGRDPHQPGLGLRHRQPWRARRLGRHVGARPGAGPPARLPAAGQPGRRGRRQSLRCDPGQWRHHRLRSGRRDRALSVPDLIVTNICFGGSDMMTAWITASSTGKLYKTTWRARAAELQRLDIPPRRAAAPLPQRI